MPCSSRIRTRTAAASQVSPSQSAVLLTRTSMCSAAPEARVTLATVLPPVRASKRQRVASFRTKGWDGLPHGPVAIDDTIGELLETQEHFPHDKAAEYC